MEMTFLDELGKSILSNQNQNAFCINGEFFSYKILAQKISGIRSALQQKNKSTENIIGLVTNDDIETYASIFALWLEGKAYIPLNPQIPAERNLHILKQTNSETILDSEKSSIYNEDFNVIYTSEHWDRSEVTIKQLKPHKIVEDKLAYIIFTSGSTGQPKGVPISFKNVNSFIEALNIDGRFKLNSNDRCLQMFELSFDMSVVSYLTPILAGACVYTIPKNVMKYFYVFKLLTMYRLTVVTMVASVIHYLRPYFKEINIEEVRYSTFAGSKLDENIAKEWSKCIPNANIINYYGPTETTIYSGYYNFENKPENKSFNGTLSIGKPFPGTEYIIIDKNEKVIGKGQEGELCIAGGQVTPGYWKNPEKNKISFFYKNHKDEQVRFYKTGDLCYEDEDGDYMYVGRIDFQVKIRGYRVELGEVEYYAKIIIPQYNIVAIDVTNELNNAELGLVITTKKFNTEKLLSEMKKKLPPYMIPTKFLFVNELPLNTNGKIDRNILRNLFNS